MAHGRRLTTLLSIGLTSSVCLASSLLTGCSSLPLGRSWTAETKPKTFATPTRMVAIWSPAMFNTSGAAPTRGFGGRLYFYDDQSRPIPVNGQLVVYAYDDSAVDPNGSAAPVADRKFLFKPEQLSSHFTPSDIGASYSIWIPWGPVDGDEAKVSLLPVFTTESGQVVSCQSSPSLLPGKKVELARKDSGDTRRLASESRSNETSSSLKTTTIPLSEGMVKQMAKTESTASESPQRPLVANASFEEAASLQASPFTQNWTVSHTDPRIANRRGGTATASSETSPEAHSEPTKLQAPTWQRPRQASDRDRSRLRQIGPPYARPFEPESSPTSKSQEDGKASSKGP